MPLDMKQIYQFFLNGINHTTDMEIPKISKSKLAYEDLLPYLYIKFELFGYPKNNGIFLNESIIFILYIQLDLSMYISNKNNTPIIFDVPL